MKLTWHLAPPFRDEQLFETMLKSPGLAPANDTFEKIAAELPRLVT